MLHSLSSRNRLGQSQAGHRPLQLDGGRIAANAGAVALNAVALLLLLAPVAVPPMAPVTERLPDIVWVPRNVEPVRPVEPIRVPVEHRPRDPNPRPNMTPSRPAPPDVSPPQLDSQPGDTLLVPTDPVAHADTDIGIDPITPPAVSAHLQTRSAPPPAYPPEAVREGLTGTVELEILVSVDGKPLEARVVRSSGHRVLDQAARKVVLTRWSFVPAMQDGQPVQALGRVPIVFTLDR